MKIKLFQLHKRSSYVFSAIQDKFSFDSQKNIYAISDGATQGYKSEIWSDKLVKSFIKKPNFEVKGLLQDFRIYAEEFSKVPITENPNPAMRALEERKRQQGGFATFMGVKIENNEVEYISSGDVCGFIKSEDYLQGFPFSNVEELDQDKGFLGTQKIISRENGAEQFRQAKISVKRGDKVILMTDAIARLCLKNNNAIQEILSLKNYDDFFQFILKEWENKRLEEDDITIGIIEITDEVKEEIYLPPADFSFPKEERPTIQFGQELNTDKMSLEEVKKHLQSLDKKVKAIEEENETLHQKINRGKRARKIGVGVNLLMLILGLSIYHFFLNKREVSKPKTELPKKVSKENNAPKNAEVANKKTHKDSEKEKVPFEKEKVSKPTSINNDKIKHNENTDKKENDKTPIKTNNTKDNIVNSHSDENPKKD